MFRAKTLVVAFFGYNILTVIPASAGTETIIHSFGNAPDGVTPFAGLINVNGTFYGTTASGGTYGNGTVYSITPAGKEVVIYSFEGLAVGDGSDPSAPLLQVGDALYGTTYEGGVYSEGTMFKISAEGEKILFSFGNAGGGSHPRTGLIEVGGALFGTTSEGGSGGGGTVFKVTLLICVEI